MRDDADGVCRELAVHSAERPATRQPQLKAAVLSILKRFPRLSDALGRSIAVPFWLKHSWSAHVGADRERKQVSALRDRLRVANEQVAHSRWLLAEWRVLTQRKDTAGREVSESSGLLDHFEKDLEAAIRAKDGADQALTRKLRAIFIGINRRPPRTGDELKAWLASPEGKAATIFEPTLAPPSDRRRRS